MATATGAVGAGRQGTSRWQFATRSRQAGPVPYRSMYGPRWLFYPKAW
jgi:hypothetical protein